MNYEDKFFGILVKTQVMLSKELASSQLQNLKINKSEKGPKLFHLNLINSHGKDSKGNVCCCFTLFLQKIIAPLIIQSI